ncbi:MAG: flavin reductase family protein [Coriobacteriales bacterium]|nr:flavin reductase family protein [Coriobacteriales bacterium]
MSDKIDLGPQGFVYPMPMTLVGADLESGPSFMPIAWINRIQFNPPRIAAGMNAAHATNAGIREHGEFSVCTPSVDLIAATDWCGLVSAARGVDKSAAFTVWRGALEHAPLIAECPLALECRVSQVVDLGSHELFVADIVGTWTEERFLGADGKPDISKLQPFVLTMPDNRSWAVGEQVGKAWSDGRGFEPDARA